MKNLPGDALFFEKIPTYPKG